MNTASVLRTLATAATAIAMWNPANSLRTTLLQDAAEQGDGEERPGARDRAVDARRGSGAIGLDGGEDEGRQRRDRQAHAQRQQQNGGNDVRPIGRVRTDTERMAHPKATTAPPANNGKRRPNRRQSMPASGETTVISTCRGTWILERGATVL